jgi:hypothetical protein
VPPAIEPQDAPVLGADGEADGEIASPSVTAVRGSGRSASRLHVVAITYQRKH